MNKYAQIIAEVLIASYLYYHKDKSIMTDQEYDEKCKYLVSQKRIKLKNGLDKLIKWKDFKNKTSLFYIKEYDYPEGLKQIAMKWLEILND